jgi:hypothetical protein
MPQDKQTQRKEARNAMREAPQRRGLYGFAAAGIYSSTIKCLLSMPKALGLIPSTTKKKKKRKKRKDSTVV